MLRRFIVERSIPDIAAANDADLSRLTRISNGALERLSFIQWQCSFVTRQRSFCLYLADGEAVIREHSRLCALPAERISEVLTILDPASDRRQAF